MSRLMMAPPFFVFLHWVLWLLNRVRIVNQKENNENGGTGQSKPSDVKVVFIALWDRKDSVEECKGHGHVSDTFELVFIAFLLTVQA